MTRAEEIAAVAAAHELRNPKIDSFEKARRDRAEQKRFDELYPPKPAKKLIKGGGIPKTDAGLDAAGVPLIREVEVK